MFGLNINLFGRTHQHIDMPEGLPGGELRNPFTPIKDNRLQIYLLVEEGMDDFEVDKERIDQHLEAGRIRYLGAIELNSVINHRYLVL